MDYAEAIAALESAVGFGVHPSLDGIRTLTGALGDPQTAFAVVQVTGTNGKSSVTWLTEALLAAEGMAVGAYTSPHLESYTERIEIGGAPIAEAEFSRALAATLWAAERSGGREAFTEFELLTAAALWEMREREVDVACLEVGMGGRWDSTSVVAPAVSVVTGVSLDHTDRLGTTVAEIAADKAHVIKPGSSVVLGPRTLAVAEVFLARAASFGLHPRFVAERGESSPVDEGLTVRFEVRARPSAPGGSLQMDVRGVHGAYPGLVVTAPSYQAANVACAVAAAECTLGRALDLGVARDALAVMRFPGRFELLSSVPPLVIDGAHNPEAATMLAGAIAEAWPDPDARPVCVLGVLADKDAAGIASALAATVGGFVVTSPSTPRARRAADLARIVRDAGGEVLETVDGVADAVREARRLAGRCGVVVTGSLYTAGEARHAVRTPQGAKDAQAAGDDGRFC